MEQNALAQEGVEDRSLHVPQVMHVLPAPHVGHKMPLVLIRQADVGDRDTDRAVLSPVLSQDTVEDKVTDVSQGAGPLDMVSAGAPAVHLLVRGQVTLGHIVNHRAVEDNRDHDQVSPPAAHNMGMEQVSVMVTVNKDQVPVVSLSTVLQKHQVQVNFLHVARVGLAQVGPLVLANKGQAQVSPLVLVNIDMGKKD